MNILQKFSRFLNINIGATDPASDDRYYSVNYSNFLETNNQFSPQTAMSVSAVYACVRILTDSISSIPFKVYVKTDKGKKEAIDHPLFSVLHRSPNPWQTSMEWLGWTMACLLLRGNAYSLIQYNSRGRIEALLPLPPDSVSVEQLPDGRLLYTHKNKENKETKYSHDYMLHIRGMSNDTIVGVSPLSIAASVFSSVDSVYRYGSSFFKNNATPSGILIHPKTLSEAAQKALREQWMQLHSGANNWHRPAVIQEGMSYQSISISAKDAQLIEAQKFGIAEIARVFGVPLHMLHELDRATFSNIEQQSIDYVVNAVRPWVVRIEQAMNRCLLNGDDEKAYFVQASMDALLRGDVKSRFEAYSLARMNGWLSVNEIRNKEDMDSVEGGDVYLTPLNMENSLGSNQ